MAVTRERLYDEIWTEPITKVSKRHGVSDSYLIRVLKNLNIPRPPRGYWAMVAAGIHPDRPSLPPADLGDPISWSRDGLTEFETSPINNGKSKQSKRKLGATHGLVREAYEHFKKLRDTNDPYLKPYKKLTIDLIVSQHTLERGFNIANELYLLLEDAGNRVRIAPHDQRIHRVEVEEREDAKTNRHWGLWQPDRPTIAYIQDVIIGLTIFEISEVVEVGYLDGKYIPIAAYLKNPLIRQKSILSWTTSQNLPSGRLCIQAYSAHPGTKWRKQWRESKPGELSKILKSIVNELSNSVAEISRLTEIAKQEAEARQRQWEIQCEKNRIEAEERKRAKNIKESKDDLLTIIESWAEAKRIDEFFKEVLKGANELPLEDYESMKARLLDASELLGTTNALERLKEWKSPNER